MSTPETMKASLPASRLYYLDALRIVLTVLVIAHHVGQAYGPTGGYWPVQEQARAAVLAPFFTVNRSFFMSLFFLISGFFMAGAYERSGFARFIRSRLVRLGIPVLVMAALTLLARVFMFGEKVTRWDAWFSAGHLWYLEHLLLFSVVYALWRKVRGEAPARPVSRALPRLPLIIAAMLVVAAACGAVRAWSPIDRWMNLAGFFSVAFADVPRDLAFFVFGALAFRRGWFESFPRRRGMAWLGVGLGAAAGWYLFALVPHAPVSRLAYDIGYLLWEELVCFGMCIGLLVAFREVVRGQGALARWLAANQYSAYFWHVLLIVPIQLAAMALPLGSFAKFVLVTIVGVPIVFLWSWLLRLLRPVRAVL
jgi:glucans biosynthesis protein C